MRRCLALAEREPQRLQGLNTIEAIFLGLVQGIAEFLPISSSGHLNLAADLIGSSEPPVLLNLCLHVATLVVIVLTYRRRIIRLFFPIDGPYLLALIITSVPTAIIGVGLKLSAEPVLGSAGWASLLLIFNGTFLLYLARLQADPTPADEAHIPKPLQALAIGVAQGIAALPGISRSGSTIGVARILGIPGARAAEFSLLASIPVIGGASLLESRHLDQLQQPGLVLLGSAVAGLSGWLAVKALLKIVDRNAWRYWGFYCIAIGGLYGVYRHV